MTDLYVMEEDSVDPVPVASLEDFLRMRPAFQQAKKYRTT